MVLCTNLMKIGYNNIYFTPVAFVTFSLSSNKCKTRAIQLDFFLRSFFSPCRKTFFIVSIMNSCNKFPYTFLCGIYGCVCVYSFVSYFRSWKTVIFQCILFEHHFFAKVPIKLEWLNNFKVSNFNNRMFTVQIKL